MIALESIRQAARLIEGKILKTPLIHSPSLSRKFNAPISLKLENLQMTGSFKIRGAFHKILLSARQGIVSTKGVVAASAGNHAQGVALAAREAGFPATIVMPQWASIGKQEATRAYGGRVVIHGATVEESLDHARALANQGLTFIHPFDDPDLIAGQATVGLEILSDQPDVNTIVVPVGGGGLIAGVCSAVKALRPQVKIIGVQAAACRSVQQCLLAGRVVSVPAKNSIADGIVVKQLGRTPFEILRKSMDEVVTVEEAHIGAAVHILLERKKVLAEGAGAAPLAALLNGAIRPAQGERVVLVVSGGNVDTPLLGRIIRRGLIENGRMVRIRLTLTDKPGTMAQLLQQIALLEANILHIRHDRSGENRALDETGVALELETRNADHIHQITESLTAAGYEIEPTV